MNTLKLLHVKAAIAMAVLALFAFYSCTPEDPEPVTPPDDQEEVLKSVTLSVQDTSVRVASTFHIDVTFDPADWADRSGQWTSTDEAIATVDENGNVTTVSEGNVVIRFSVSESIFDECSLEVFEEEIPIPTEIALNQTYVEIAVGETYDLNVITIDSDDYTHPELLWESSDNQTATVSESGVVTGMTYGTLLVRAVFQGLEAYCFVSVTDPSQPTEYDASWLEVPYPYLEYPTTKEKIIAAENASKEDEMILRKLIKEEGDQLSFEVRPYFDYGPSSPMFNNTFYNLNPAKGDRFAWGYCLGIYRQDMVDGVMAEMMPEIGYKYVKNVDRSDGTYASWYANADKNRSALIYVLPYNDGTDRMYGVIEWRVLEDDPLNDGGGNPDEADPLPERFMQFGASRDEIRAFEEENGGVLNSAWSADYNLAYNLEPDEFSTFFVNYLIDDYGELYKIQLFLTDCDYIFADAGTTLNSDFVEDLKANGYTERSATEYYNAEKDLSLEVAYYDYNVITNGPEPTCVINYEK